MRESTLSALVIGIFLLNGLPSANAEIVQGPVPAFCENAKGVREIKAFINCQSDPKLGACSGLEARQAGKFPMAPVLLSTVDAAADKKKAFVDALANEFNKERASWEVTQADFDRRSAAFETLSKEADVVDGEFEKFVADHGIGKRIDMTGMSLEEKTRAQVRLSNLNRQISISSRAYMNAPDGTKDLLSKKLEELGKEKSKLESQMNAFKFAEPTSDEIRRLEDVLNKLNEQEGRTSAESKSLHQRRQNLERKIAEERARILERYEEMKAKSESIHAKMRAVDGFNSGAKPIPGTTSTVDTQALKAPRAANTNLTEEVVASHRRQAEAVFQELSAQASVGKPVTPESAEAALTRHAKELFPDYEGMDFVRQRTGPGDGLWGRMNRLKNATLQLADSFSIRPTGTAATQASLTAGNSAANGIASESAERQIENLASRSTVSAAVNRTMQTGAKALTVLGGPYVTAALAAAEVVFTPSDAACADHSAYVNADASRGCKPRYEVNQDVVRFLDLPEEEQARLLRTTPTVCAFYEKLHEKVFRKNQFERLVCKGNGGFVLHSRNADGELIEHNVSLNEKKSIRRIELARDGSPHGDLRFNPDGTLFSSMESPGNLEKVMSLKMYIVGAKDCCLSDGEPHAKCMDSYNSKESARPASGKGGGKKSVR